MDFFLRSSFLLVAGLFALDLVAYQGFVGKHLGVPAWLVAAMVLAIHLGIRLTKKVKIGDTFAAILLFVILPATTLLPGIFYALEESSFLHVNYFFENFHLYYHTLFFAALPMAGFSLVHSSKEMWSKLWRWRYFSGVVNVLFFLWSFSTIFPRAYLQVIGEDGIVENLTFIFFILSGVLAFLLARKKLFKQKIHQMIFVGLMLVAGLAFLVVAGEEISWGQRMFGWETLTALAENNTQAETNIHNSTAVWPLVYVGYAIIAIYGSFAWLGQWMLQPILDFRLKGDWRVWLNLAVPQAHLFLNFAFLLVYLYLRERHGPWKYQAWEEMSELFMVVGIAVHLGRNYFVSE
jgi:hypothetical protein